MTRPSIILQRVSVTPDVKNSIESDDNALQLVNDENAPGAGKVYGTDSEGVKGWKDDPTPEEGGVESVTGDGVNNADPLNPVLSFPTKSDIGLGNVDNTPDTSKPVSTAQATADALVASNAATDATTKANAAQAAAVQRGNHTGTQIASTISDFNTAVASTAALKANNLSDLTDASSARSSLGLGTLATQSGTFTDKQNLVNSATALVDASTMDLTAIKHTLATSSATRTFTISYTGDDITLEVTLSATSSTFTFPSGTLCVSEGTASGDNTCSLSGVSGDIYMIAIKKIGSNYRVVCKNFGQ